MCLECEIPDLILLRISMTEFVLEGIHRNALGTCGLVTNPDVREILIRVLNSDSYRKRSWQNVDVHKAYFRHFLLLQEMYLK